LPSQELISILAEMAGALAVTLLLGLSPRLNSVPPVGFKYPQREVKFALYIVTAALVINYLLFRFGVNWLPTMISDKDGNAFTLLLTAALATVIIVVIALRARGQPSRSTGWQKALTRPAIQFGLSLVILTLFLRGKFLTVLGGIPQDALRMLVILLLIALAEETIFRGYVQMRFMAKFGRYGGWAIASIVYVLWRLPFLMYFGFQDSLLYFQIAILGLKSFLLGWIMIRSRHALVPALYHAFSMWIAYL